VAVSERSESSVLPGEIISAGDLDRIVGGKDNISSDGGRSIWDKKDAEKGGSSGNKKKDRNSSRGGKRSRK
jgi:hypothetical protein